MNDMGDNPEMEQRADLHAGGADAGGNEAGDESSGAEPDPGASAREPDPGTPATDDAGASADAGSSEIVEQVRTALRGVSDPELGLSIVDLGLVYDIELEGALARVTMTLTSPGCPAGGQILGDAKRAAESVEGVTEAEVNLVWKPFWTPDRIDPKVRAMMGF